VEVVCHARVTINNLPQYSTFMLPPPPPSPPPPSPLSLSSLPLLSLSSPQLYDLDRGEVVSVLSGHHKKGLYGVRFSKTQENLMGTVSSDHTVRATFVVVV
jgi:WD40 repeat protein